MNLFFAILLGFFVGGVAGYLGSLMLTKRMALVGGAFGHLALPGIALALVYGFDVSIGALIFLIFGMFLVWIFEERSKLPMEALSAIVFTGSLSVAWIFLPENKRATALIGNLSNLNIYIVIISIIVSILAFFIVKSIFKKMMLISISNDIANVMGINSKKYNIIYLICIVIVTALGVRIIGGLMTAALIAIPASTSRNISKSIKSYSYMSLVFGSLSTSFGILFSPIIKISAGPMIVIISSFMFLLSLFFKKIN